MRTEVELAVKHINVQALESKTVCANYFILFPGTGNIIVPTSQGCCEGLDELPFVKGSILAHIKNFINIY